MKFAIGGTTFSKLAIGDTKWKVGMAKNAETDVFEYRYADGGVYFKLTNPSGKLKAPLYYDNYVNVYLAFNRQIGKSETPGYTHLWHLRGEFGRKPPLRKTRYRAVQRYNTTQYCVKLTEYNTEYFIAFPTDVVDYKNFKYSGHAYHYGRWVERFRFCISRASNDRIIKLDKTIHEIEIQLN